MGYFRVSVTCHDSDCYWCCLFIQGCLHALVILLIIVARVPSIPDQSRAHMRNTCAHAYIYINYLISVPFFFFVDCRVRVRVSSRVRDSVSFIFYCIFSFRRMLKDRKLQLGQWCTVGVVVQSSYCAY